MEFQRAKNAAAPSPDRLKNDIDNQQFNDVYLQGTDNEIVPCSRVVLSMSSPVFADLFDYPDETTFPSPFSGWLLREIRNICYFGTSSSFQGLKSVNNEPVRKLCQLLVAMDYYQLTDDSLLEPIYNDMVSKMNATPSLACVVMDEFDVKSEGEARKWIRKSIVAAASLFKNDPYKVLLPENDAIGGASSIQDSNKMQAILSKLKKLSNTRVWLELETLYRWARTNESNQDAAVELWEETDMLQRLVIDDPDHFDKQDISATYNPDNFAMGQDFVALYRYASEKNKSRVEDDCESIESTDVACSRVQRMNRGAFINAGRPRVGQSRAREDGFCCCTEEWWFALPGDTRTRWNSCICCTRAARILIVGFLLWTIPVCFVCTALGADLASADVLIVLLISLSTYVWLLVFISLFDRCFCSNEWLNVIRPRQE